MGTRAFSSWSGAGFLGSHFTDRLLASERTRRVTLFDNFSSGQAWHYEQHAGDRRLQVVRADVHDFAALRAAMADHDTVIHLASNPDIARAVTEPDIDFREGTELTHLVVEAMRRTGTRAHFVCFRQRRLWRTRGGRSCRRLWTSHTGVHLRRQ